jgi:hypothetical protein
MKFTNEHRFNENLEQNPNVALKAQEMADFVEQKLSNGENLDDAFDALFESYYESMYWLTFDSAFAMLYNCWVYGYELEEFRNTKFIPAS